MRILCVGAGAIGLLMGGSFASEGDDVTFLLKAGKKRGIEKGVFSIRHSRGEKKIKKYSIVKNVTKLNQMQPFECVFIAVKTFDSDTVIRELKKIKKGFQAIVCWQNGVESEAKFAEAFPDVEIIAASIGSAVNMIDEQTIRLEKNRGVAICGSGPICQHVVKILTEADLKPKMYQNCNAMKWTKMISNLFANAISAILDMAPEEIYQRKGLFQIEKKQVLEGLSVMRRAGIPVLNLPGLPLKLLAICMQYLPNTLLQPILRKLVAGGRGDKMPSFYLEKHKGSKRSEASDLNGAIVRFGKTFGISTPVNQALTKILEEILGSEQQRKKYSRNPVLLEKTILNI